MGTDGPRGVSLLPRSSTPAPLGTAHCWPAALSARGSRRRQSRPLCHEGSSRVSKETGTTTSLSKGPFLVACFTNGKLTEEGTRDFTGTSTGARQAAPKFLHGHRQQQCGTFSSIPHACSNPALLSLKKLFPRKAADGFGRTSDGATRFAVARHCPALILRQSSSQPSGGFVPQEGTSV